MKWIRWQGVIAFLAAIAVISVLWFFLIGHIIKRGIEKAGTAIVGAKVELKKADLTLFPLGLTLTELQVTNPGAPMTNAFEAGRIAFLIDGVDILRRKLIVEDMSVEGVRLNTPRATSGAVPKKAAVKKAGEKPAEEGPKLLTFEVPDPKTILAKESLESLKLIEKTRADIDAEKLKWEKELKSLMDKKKIDDYRARIEKLKGMGKGVGGALGGASEFLTLQNEIKADIDHINTVKTGLDDSISLCRKRVEEASKAPFKDIERIKEKYSLTPQGLSNLSRMFLGGTITEWTDTSLRWYRRLDPVIKQASAEKDGVEVVKPPRGKGVNVRFREYKPLPDFLVRRASVSVNIPVGDIKGLITNITPDQEILGSPMRFSFSGEKLKGLSSVKLDGEINRVNRSRPEDKADLDLTGYKIKGFSLSGSRDFPVVLDEGLSDLKVQAKISGQSLGAEVSAGLRSLKVSAGKKEEKSPVAKAIASALSDIKGFNVKADVAGTIENYDLHLSSDLDRVLKDAVGRFVSAQAAELEKGLKYEVSKRTGGQLDGLKAGFGGLIDIDGEVKNRLNLGEGLLKDMAKGGAPGFKLPKLPF